MQTFYKVDNIKKYLRKFNTERVGFVATMGALHEGHISLIKASKTQNDITICSIFVNPEQFNKKEDLINYPRDITSDIKKIEKSGCDIAFVPSIEEMYPKPVQKKFHFGILSEVMEAKHRPGHFNGVAIVIERLFEILNPHNAYFGEKDFQQLAVIKNLVRQLNSPVNIIGCPIHREKGGLAMSSRNELLSIKDRDTANLISQALRYVAQNRKKHTVSELKIYFNEKIAKTDLLKIEYFEISDKETLAPVSNWSDAKNYIACTAINLGNIRLIDNMTIIN